MRISLLILSVLFGAGLAAQEQLTLSECVERAWQNNLQVQQAELNMTASEEQLKSSKMDVLPNLNAFATHNYNWGQRIDPFTNQFANTRVQSNSFGISSSLDLFNGLQNYRSIQAQDLSLEAARYSVEDQKFQIALSVATAFLTVLLNEELVVAAEQQVEISRTQLDRIRKMVQAGAQNIGVQYDLEAQLGQDQSTLVQRQNEYLLSRVRLKQLMLMPASDQLQLIKPDLEADTTLRLENTETVYGYAETTMPNVKSAEYSLMSWEKQLGAVRSGYYPSLTLSGSLGSGYSGLQTEIVDVIPTGTEPIGFTQQGLETVVAPTFETEVQRIPFANQVGDNFNQFVGLSLNVPVFNRYNVKNSVSQAKVNQSIAELQLEQEKQNLRQDIETARADAFAARELYKSNKKALASAEKAFEFAEVRFEAGSINVMEFNVSKNNLLIAQANVSRSLYDYIFRTKLLDYYMGKPLGFGREE